LARSLKPRGLFYLATDWEQYADEVKASLLSMANLLPAPQAVVPHRPTTRFEARGVAEGRPILELVYQKRSD